MYESASVGFFAGFANELGELNRLIVNQAAERVADTRGLVAGAVTLDGGIQGVDQDLIPRGTSWLASLKHPKLANRNHPTTLPRKAP